jgi:catechol 2,3-dioxygenase-like lactoylglutathione lyase family enzyme
MDVPRLMHVRVNVRDFDRAVAWYESVLGLTATGHWPPDAPAYSHFDTGGAQFAISVMEPVPADLRDPDGNELGFVRDP